MSLEFPVEEDHRLDGKLDLVRAAIRRLTPEELSGYDLVLRSNAPPGSGLGSSSAMMVSLVGLLQHYSRAPMTEYEMANLAYVIERQDLGITGGLQDHYAATFGGFNFIEFGERVVVNPLRVRDSIVGELEINLLLCYTGLTRASNRIIDDQTSRVREKSEETLEGLRAQKDLAYEMKTHLLRGELDAFGVLLGEAWQQKKKMSPMISNPRIDEIYEVAMEHAALGGKVTGAGGGGYILFYCDFSKKHRLAEALVRMDAPVTEFSFAPRGVATWTS